jgi:hypothetical protein
MVDLQLNGHRAIVTGSSAGIGEAIARKLAAEDVAVIVHRRRAHTVKAVAQAISRDGGQAEVLTADLADPGNCAWLISLALACAVRHQRRGRGPVHPRFPVGHARVRLGTDRADRDRRGGESFPTMPGYAASKTALLGRRKKWPAAWPSSPAR